MEITLILQVITISITILTIFVDYLYNLKINQKTRTFGLIGQEIVDILNNFRNQYASILNLSDVESIKQFKYKNETANRYNASYAKNLNFSRAKIRTLSLPFWDKEKHLHDTMDKLCKLCLAYYEKPVQEHEAKIKKLRDEFFIECSIYDWALWEYCQEQISGNKVTRENLEKHYFSVLTRIENSGSGKSVRFKDAFDKIYKNFAEKKEKIKIKPRVVIKPRKINKGGKK